MRELEEATGYAFRDARLGKQALTHASWANERGDRGLSNERLEFLGDAVLELVVSQWLYRHMPGAPEGELTRTRAALVSEPSLARIARQMELGRLLRLSRGETKTGGADKPALLADAFEAVAGAILLDGGLEAARTFILDKLGIALEEARQGRRSRDYKTELQEKLQSMGMIATYRIVEEHGPAHAMEFVAAAMLENEELARGSGSSKKDAEQAAAEAALKGLGEG